MLAFVLCYLVSRVISIKLFLIGDYWLTFEVKANNLVSVFIKVSYLWV